MLKDRAGRLQESLREWGVEALVVVAPVNLRYLCGFTGSDGALIISGSAVRFLTDSRYTTQARGQVIADEVREYSEKIAGIIDCLRASGIRKAGFEAASIVYSVLARLQEGGPDID